MRNRIVSIWCTVIAICPGAGSAFSNDFGQSPEKIDAIDLKPTIKSYIERG